MTVDQPHVAESAAQPAASFVAYTRVPPAERFLERYLGESCPVRLPDAHRGYFVRGLPWAPIVAAPFYLIALGATAIGFVFGGPAGMLNAVLTIVAVGFGVLAVPGLFRRSRGGWAFLTYATAVTLLQSAVNLDVLQMLFEGAFLWAVFQVKYRYV